MYCRAFLHGSSNLAVVAELLGIWPLFFRGDFNPVPVRVLEFDASVLVFGHVFEYGDVLASEPVSPLLDLLKRFDIESEMEIRRS